MRALLVAALLVSLAAAGALGPADAATLQLSLYCDDDGPAPFASMEASYIADGCWGHFGMHQYFVGRHTIYALQGGSGHAFVVEQQLSPPAEVGGVYTGPPQYNTTVPIETSLDGKAWTLAANAEYRFAGLQPGGTSFRQDLRFTFTAAGESFRFLRLREPLSAAQGLSGYLDFSELTLDVDVVGPAPALTLTPQTGVAKSCLSDILEDVWAAHPCSFGGVEHWDSPSWTHTYFLGDARLERVQGTAVLAYFRPDDLGTCCGQTLDGWIDGDAHVQTSLDGIAWDTLHTEFVTYGAPWLFDVDGLGGKEASFLRLVSAKHPGYWNHPALKHPEALLAYSDVSLSGQLP